jgi:hypothetical protein
MGKCRELPTTLVLKGSALMSPHGMSTLMYLRLASPHGSLEIQD